MERSAVGRGGPRIGSTLVAAVVLAATAACLPEPELGDPPAAEPAPTPSVGTASPAPSPTPDAPAEVVLPEGPTLGPVPDEPEVVLADLQVPWGIAFLPTGAALVTLRDAAQVVLLTADGPVTLGGPGAEELVDDTETTGEGGLLGVAVSPTVADDLTVYLYRTTPDGNEVVRTRLDPEGAELAELEVLVDGIPAAPTHNGGRIAFGPDGKLYVGTGDAGDPEAAQDGESLAGKILRLTPEGRPAPGNPVQASPVWSLGHRNVQGLAWDAEGRMYASELGQDAHDELNLIVPAGNYGWPEVEGPGGGDGFVDPLASWAPAEASPSGVAVTEGADGLPVVHVAALRGARLWSVEIDEDEPYARPSLVGAFGRLRDVVAGPDGALWVLTGNTDGRGDPAPEDDRLLRLAPPGGVS